MGLDHGLNGIIRIPEEKQEQIQNIIGCELTPLRVYFRICEWRKINSIHGYIVNKYSDDPNIQHDIFLDKDKIQELLDRVKIALKTKDTEILPTHSGFFWGSTDYDDYYWNELKIAKEGLEKALQFLDAEKERFSRSIVYWQWW